MRHSMRDTVYRDWGLHTDVPLSLCGFPPIPRVALRIAPIVGLLHVLVLGTHGSESCAEMPQNSKRCSGNGLFIPQSETK